MDVVKFTAYRYHDISCGHRVCGHENKCKYLHGHNYRIHFWCRAQPIYKMSSVGPDGNLLPHQHGNPAATSYTAVTVPNPQQLDKLGRVIDFGVIKSLLCQWLEDNWDHKFLMWKEDPILASTALRPSSALEEEFYNSVVGVPFNPTAENMADYLLTVIGPQQFKSYNVELVKVQVDETRKCSAVAELT